MPVDIQHLVDRLEDLIDDGRHIFGTKYTMIDEERALEIIDQMRISIPEEIEKAARVVQQRDRLLAEANEEAARIVQQARQKGEAMVDEEATVSAARTRAQHILEQARQEATKITDEADAYVIDKLSELERTLQRDIEEVRAGIAHLRDQAEDHRNAAEAAQQQPVHIPMPVERETVDVELNGNRDDHDAY